MDPIGVVDLVSFLAVLTALVILWRGWKRALERDARFLLAGLLAVTLFHGFSNTLEWSGVTEALDPFEDFVQLLEPILWVFLFYAFLTAVDIAERKRAAEALRESEQNFRDLVENLLDGVAIADENAYHIYVNPRFAEITGYSVDELLNMTGWDFTRPEDLARFKQRMKKRTVGEPHKRMYERVIVRKGGTEVLTEMSTTTTVWRGKKRPLAIIRDITERKRTEEELSEYRTHLEELVEARTAELDRRVAEVESLNRAMTNLLNDLQAANRKLAETGQELQRANAELETFTYSVSHDLKAPLRGIDGYSRLLLEDHAGQLDDEGRTFLHTIRHAAEQMKQLINDLLAYSRLERRAMRTTSINPRALVEALVAEYAEQMRERGVGLTVDVPCQAVMAEAEGLAQALRNLLDNALKFTRDAPEPRIEIGRVASRIKVTETYSLPHG